MLLRFFVPENKLHLLGILKETQSLNIINVKLLKTKQGDKKFILCKSQLKEVSHSSS